MTTKISLKRNNWFFNVGPDLPKDDHTDFVQEERVGLPYWTMNLATCVVVNVSRCLDTLTWKVSAMLQRPSFFTWV